MSERIRDGLAAARARGRTGGQKPKLGPRQVALARQMYDERDGEGRRRYTVAQIGVTQPTIYRHLVRHGPTPPDALHRRAYQYGPNRRAAHGSTDTASVRTPQHMALFPQVVCEEDFGH